MEQDIYRQQLSGYELSKLIRQEQERYGNLKRGRNLHRLALLLRHSAR